MAAHRTLKSAVRQFGVNPTGHGFSQNAGLLCIEGHKQTHTIAHKKNKHRPKTENIDH